MEKQVIIILISLGLGLCSGVVMHRSDFCIAGMFRDLFLFRNSPLLPSLVLLISISMLLFESARLIGLLHYQLPSSLFGLPSLTTLIGGIIFGLGMVLAGGCVVGTLYKLGSGSFPAFFAFLGLLAGSAGYAELHPWWSQLAKKTQLTEAATVPQLLNQHSTVVILPLLVISAIFISRWRQQGKIVRPNYVKGYLQPWLAAVILAVVGLFSFSLTGMPLGITTSYTKIGAFLEQSLVPEHVASLGYFQGHGFHYLSPLSGKVLSAGAGPFWDGLALVQFPLISGILLGSGFSATTMGKFKLRFNQPKTQLLSALIGGILMGLAARMAPACNVWHLLGGLPLLSLQSLLFALGLLPGAWLGSKLLTRYVVTG